MLSSFTRSAQTQLCSVESFAEVSDLFELAVCPHVFPVFILSSTSLVSFVFPSSQYQMQVIVLALRLCNLCSRRRVFEDNLGIIFAISPFQHMLWVSATYVFMENYDTLSFNYHPPCLFHCSRCHRKAEIYCISSPAL